VAWRPAQFTRLERIQAATTVALVPVTILIHEAAHLLIGILFGVPQPRLHFAGFTHGPAPWLDRWEVATITLAGPVATLSLAAASLSLFARRRQEWLISLGVAACTRLFELFPFALAAVRRRAVGVSYRPTTLDEDRGAQLLGLPGNLSLIAVTVTLAVILFLLWKKASPPFSKGYAVGAIVGWAAWMAVLGPAIMP